MSISIKSSSPRQSSLDGKFAWEQGTGQLKTSTTSIAVTPSSEGGVASDIVKAIDDLPDVGGTIYLRNGTYLLDSDIVIPNYVTLLGESIDGVIIDFQSRPYQIKAQGSNAYSEGTVAVDNNDVVVTGTDTAWTADMIGQSIIISGIFFVITDVASATSLEIEAPFDSPSVSGVDYMIADPATGMAVKSLTVQNSTSEMGAILFKYVASANQEDLTVYDSTIGFNFVDSSFASSEGITAIGCGVGINIDHAGVWTLTDFGAYSCDTNIVFNRFISGSVSNATASSAVGNGITITNSSNLGIYDMTITTNGANGIELSDSHGIQIFSMALEDNIEDGIKLTSEVDHIVMNSLAFTTNGGYGINIVDSTSEDNVISSSVFDGNIGGEYDDNGTDTLILQTAGGGGGSGDVVGPSSSVVSEVALFDGTTGKLIKRATGTGIAKLTSGVLSAGTITTSEVDPGAITYDKIQDISATDRLLGRDTAAGGDIEELTVGGGLSFTGSGGIQSAAHTGDVTKAAGGTVNTIAPAVVTPAMRTGGFFAVNHAFADATGSQAITGVGFAPKGLIVIGSNEASTSTLPLSNGYAYNTGAGTVQGGKFGVMSESGPSAGSINSTSNCFVRSDASGSGTFVAAVTVWDADGITVSVSTSTATAANRTFHIMFFG